MMIVGRYYFLSADNYNYDTYLDEFLFAQNRCLFATYTGNVVVVIVDCR
jgi:hypothetical protein